MAKTKVKNNPKKNKAEAVDINFRLDSFLVSQYSFSSDSIVGIDVSNFDMFEFNVNMNFGVTEDLQTVALRCDAKMRQRDIENPTTIIRIVTDSLFGVEKIEDFITDNAVALPEWFWGILISISLSTTRGVLIGKNFGTPFGNIVMPIFQIKDLIPTRPVPIASLNLYRQPKTIGT